MTDEEIARSFGLIMFCENRSPNVQLAIDAVMAALAAARADERAKTIEQCAKMCEEVYRDGSGYDTCEAILCADAIRAMTGSALSTVIKKEP